MALALTAMLGASSASAAQFKAEEYPVSFNGSAATTQIISTNTGKMKCLQGTFLGSEAAASSSLALAPGYGSCAFAGLQMGFNSNGCKFVLTSTNGTPPFVGTLGVSCSSETGAMMISTPAFGCTVSIPVQSGLSAVEFENTGTGTGRSITAVLNVSGLSYTESSKCFSPGAHTNGTYTGSISIPGLNAKGKAEGVFLG